MSSSFELLPFTVVARPIACCDWRTKFVTHILVHVQALFRLLYSFNETFMASNLPWSIALFRWDTKTCSANCLFLLRYMLIFSVVFQWHGFEDVQCTCCSYSADVLPFSSSSPSFRQVGWFRLYTMSIFCGERGGLGDLEICRPQQWTSTAVTSEWGIKMYFPCRYQPRLQVQVEISNPLTWDNTFDGYWKSRGNCSRCI